MLERVKPLFGNLAAAARRVASTALRRCLNHGVNILAAAAVILLMGTITLGIMDNPPFVLEPEKRPFLYDLSLAILGAWIFQQLLISLPARRKVKSAFHDS